MRRLILAAALVLSSVLSVEAAYSQTIVQHAKAQSLGVSAVAVTLNSVAAGDTLIIIPTANSNVTVTGATDSAGDTVHTDQAFSTLNPGSANYGYGFYSVLATPNAGTHIITVSVSASTNKELYVAEVSGLGASAAFQAASTMADGNSTSALTNSVTPTTAGSLAIAVIVNGGNGITYSSWLNSFTQADSAGTVPNGVWAYLANPTTGSALSTGATLSLSENWVAGVAVYKPGAAASCTHAGFSMTGAVAVPNGTTGSYWLKPSSSGAPNCSSTSYWQPALGNFGVN